MTTAQPATYEKLRSALRLLGPEPSSAEPLADALGMRPIRNAANLVAPKGVPTELAKQLSDYVQGFYRVGEADLGEGTAVGLYLAPLTEWQRRSSDRERYRRKIAKALIEQQQRDARWIVILLDPRGASHEAEFVMPRQRPGAGIGTVRATVNLRNPNRYHAELLDDLTVPAGATLRELAAQWSEAFSVERVTKRFYEEFRVLRDRLIDALLKYNPDNPALKGRDRKKDREFDLQLHAFGTRQLGRLLFLWFLQQKRWLGNSAGDGSLHFLVDLFHEERPEANSYYNDVLAPIFFDGLGLPRKDPAHRAVEDRFGPMPFLGGGLFRAGADEFEATLFGLSEDGMERTRRVVLPDDLFDPTKDRPEKVGRRGEADRTVLGLLRGYRFTTQESTPDDQSVDLDPELLGKVFENLYQGDARHETGAYYTPREIVHYMCRQTVDSYLRERTGIPQEDIDWLRQQAVDWTVSDRRLDPRMISKLEHALEDVKILDPAVGSGAFLLAAIREIVLLRRGIQQSELDRDIERGSLDVADWKRHAATNCVYGVDINPMAVEICHLRLLLSIVVDLEVSDFRDIPALPNLDFRVVAGDSLIDRMGEKDFMQSLPPPEGLKFGFELGGKVEALQKKVDRWREEFAGEGTQERDAKRLRNLSRKIRDKQAEIVRLQLDHEIEEARLNLKLLESPGVKKMPTKKRLQAANDHLAGLERLKRGLHDDAPYQKPFLWPVNFHEIFEEGRGGFDIVLANPPYVRQESLDPIDQVAYSHAFPDVYHGMADILVYFYARAVQVLREGGQLAFITSNKYMRAAYGDGLRGFLPGKLQIQRVIDFGDLPLFTVAAYPAVLIGTKAKSPDGNGDIEVTDLVYPIRRRLAEDGQSVNTDSVRLALDALPELLKDVAVPDYPQVLLNKEGWILEDPALVRLFDRLMSRGTPLGEYVHGRVYRGVLTGLNEAFVIDDAKRAKLIAADRRSAELIRPWLRGRDIRRWESKWAGLYVIAVQNSGDADAGNPWGNAKTEAEARQIFRKTYPVIHDHLSRFENSFIDKNGKRKPGLRPRADQGRWWWELRACAYYREFERPKIIWPEFPKRVRFAWVPDPILTNNKCYLWADPPLWMLAILNTNLFEFLLSHLTVQMRGSYLQLYDHFVRRLPIMPADDAKLSELEELATNMIESPIDAGCEHQIEMEVRDIYGVNEGDSALIDEWFNRRWFGESGQTDENEDDT